MDDIANLLFVMRSKGVKIWTEGGQLRYQTLQGSLTRADLNKLRTLRSEILAFFHQSTHPSATDPKLTPRSESDRAPLTFSQQWFWKGLDLETRASVRMIASVVRLSGHLNIASLRESFVDLVRRHEPLRTRIVTEDGIPTQRVDEGREYELEIIELTKLSPSERESNARRLVQQLVNEPCNVAVGPLFVTRLLKLGESEHVLVMAIDHVVSDAASLGVLWRDVFTMYAHSIKGEPCLLPEIPVQFADFAIWQQKTHAIWMKEHGGYWRDRLAGAQRVRLAEGSGMSELASVSWKTTPIRFGEILSARLRELSRREKTSIVMSVLTAFVALIFHWTQRNDVVVPFTTIGRSHYEVQNIVGFFGAPLFLRLELDESDSFLDLLRRVTKEYSAACGHDDSCRIAAEIPEPEFVWNPVFNWIPQEFNMKPTGPIHACEGEDSLRVEQVEFELILRNSNRWGGELRVDLSDTNEGVTGALGYRSDLSKFPEIENFQKNFRSRAERLAMEPNTRVAAMSRVG